VTQASRRQIASLFLTFSLVILVGCLLENYAGLRPVSDAVRNVLYSKGIYENDLRDVGGVASAPQRDRRPAGDVMARTARCVSKDGDCDDQDEQRQRHKTRRMHHRTMTPAPGKSRQSPPVTDISPRRVRVSGATARAGADRWCRWARLRWPVQSASLPTRFAAHACRRPALDRNQALGAWSGRSAVPRC
jgi:hypothetical protein